MQRGMLVAAVLAGFAAVAASARPADADVHRRKIATALSGIGVAVSSGLILSSFFVNIGQVDNTLLYIGIGTSIITPSLGEYYAHQWLTVGEGIRVGGGALAILGANQTEQTTCNNGQAGTCTSLTGLGVALLGIGAIAYVGGAAYDVLDAGNAVDRYDLRVSVVPMPLPSGAGVALAGHW
jgi:hypothetical protein